MEETKSCLSSMLYNQFGVMEETKTCLSSMLYDQFAVMGTQNSGGKIQIYKNASCHDIGEP